MKTSLSMTRNHRGSSLVEAVIAMGVLSVAIPLVFGAIAESGKTGMSSEAETRSTWMVPACMEEIRASREGVPQYFTTTTVNEKFPTAGGVWALAFTRDGKPIGKIDKAVYDKGTKTLDGKDVGFIANISSTDIEEPEGRELFPEMLRVLISIEYPSVAPAAKRQKLDFYTRIP